jgi:hypothetical protein
MSLNRVEQMLLDYWEKHLDEKRHWQFKVREAAAAADPLAAARLIERDLWRYFEERSGQVEPFRSTAGRYGCQRISLLNLAEYVVRLWGPPVKRRPASPSTK